MKTVELFAGIGGFRLAGDRAGLRTVWANDHSPTACRVYEDCFGKGELIEADFADVRDKVPEHDLLTAGFPCQPFSSAGKKHGIRDVRGTLFRHIVDVLDRRRPRFFVLENVKRLLVMEQGAHFATILAALSSMDYTVEWRLLNAIHFGLPQNRERVFLIGERDVSSSTKEPSVSVRLACPDDFGSRSKQHLTELLNPGNWRPISAHRKSFSTWGMSRSDHFVSADLPCFSQATPLTRLAAVLEESVPDEFDFTDTTRRRLDAGRTVNRFVNGVEILSNEKGGARMGYTIFGVQGVAPTLTSSTSRHYERYQIGDRFRRLTNVEYARIQGFPDSHCRAASIYDQYALIGNAVPPPMAEWVIRKLMGRGLPVRQFPVRSAQGMLF